MCPEEMSQRHHFETDFEEPRFVSFACVVFFAEEALDEEEVLEVFQPDEDFAVDFSSGDFWVVDILGVIYQTRWKAVDYLHFSPFQVASMSLI